MIEHEHVLAPISGGRLSCEECGAKFKLKIGPDGLERLVEQHPGMSASAVRNARAKARAEKRRAQ